MKFSSESTKKWMKAIAIPAFLGSLLGIAFYFSIGTAHASSDCAILGLILELKSIHVNGQPVSNQDSIWKSDAGLHDGRFSQANSDGSDVVFYGKIEQ